MSCFTGNCFFHQHSFNFLNEIFFAFSSRLNFTKMKRLSISWPLNRSALSEQIQSFIADRPHRCSREFKRHFNFNSQLWLIRGINCLPQKYEQNLSENFKFWWCCKVDCIATSEHKVPQKKISFAPPRNFFILQFFHFRKQNPIEMKTI